MTIGIYKLNFTGTDKVYIGQSIHIEKRFREHLNVLSQGLGAIKLQKAYSTYGIPNIEILEAVTPVELDKKEIFYISKYNSMLDGFNSTEGGFSSFESIAPWSTYSEYLIKEVFKYLIYTEYDYEIIEELTGVTYSVIRDIANCRSHSWLKFKYPRQYKLLESKLNTRVRIKFDKNNIVKALKLLVEDSLLHEDIAKKCNLTTNMVRSISKFQSHKWLSTKYPELYNKLIQLKSKIKFNKTSKYTKEDILEIIEYKIMGLSYTEIESITGVPTSTQKNIISQRQHKWVQIEYPELYNKLKNKNDT